MVFIFRHFVLALGGGTKVPGLNLVLVVLRIEFDFWNVHGMNLPKLEFITYIYILL